MCDLRNVASGFLHAVDARMCTQQPAGFRLEIHTGAGGNVVGDQRQLHSVGNGKVVRGKSFLRCLVVIRRDREQRVCAAGFGLPGKAHRLRGAVGPHAGDDFAAPGAVGDRVPDQRLALLRRERGCFSCRAADDDGGDPGVKLACEYGVVGFKIDPVFQKRRDDGGRRASEDRFFHKNTSVPLYESTPERVREVAFFPRLRYNTARYSWKESGNIENK